MIEILPESHDNVIGIKASGMVSASDYENILIPGIDNVLAKHETCNFLYFLSGEFKGFELGAMWDDAKYLGGHINSFRKLAVVGGPAWAGWLSRFVGLFVHSEVKTFGQEQLTEAWQWVEG